MLSAPLYQWEFLKLNLIWAYRGPVPEQYRDGMVSGDYVALWHLTKGQAVLLWITDQLTIQEGDWVLIPPGKIRQSFSKDAELWSIRFVMNASSNRCLLEGQKPIKIQVGKKLESACKRLIQTVQGMFGNKRMELLRSEASLVEYLKLETHFRIFIQSLLLRMEQEGIQMKDFGEMDSRLQQCIWDVQHSPLTKNFTENELAQFAGVSVSQLNRLFHEYFGHSSRVWLDGYRYTEGQRLLIGSSPIKAVSYSLGFSSPQHFASWFRQRSDLTPSEWRKRQHQ